jgi:hypothetical protein
VASSSVNNNNFNATVGYTVSGTVGYDGAKTGPIYLAMNGCSNPTPGTAILAPGAFTIHGVPPGVYTLKAWMDNLGYGVQNLSNPLGHTSNVLVPNANNTNLTVGMADPSAVTLSSAPVWTGNASGAFSGGAFVSFSTIRNSSNVEIPTSYILEYSTDSTFKTGVTSKSFPAAHLDPYWIVTGLANGGPYYFRAAGVVGSGSSAVIGPWSAASPSGGLTIRPRAPTPFRARSPSARRPPDRSMWASSTRPQEKSTLRRFRTR